MILKVTVCEFQDQINGFAQYWEELVAHVKEEVSDIVLLPEMPFYPWLFQKRPFNLTAWQAAVNAHDIWQKRFDEVAPAIIIGSRPVNNRIHRWNEGFVWEQCHGYNAAHHKYYLPDEEGYWEASWYHQGHRKFVDIQSGDLRIGFLICTELWFTEHARAYGQSGVQLIVNPRATGKANVDKWLICARASAIISGAFLLSSNHASLEDKLTGFDGQSWVIGPNGCVLGRTSRQQPFVTVEIDLAEAEHAKQTYPRYVVG